MIESEPFEISQQLEHFIAVGNLSSVYLYLEHLKNNEQLKEEFWRFHLFSFIQAALQSQFSQLILTQLFKNHVHESKDFLSYYLLIYQKPQFNLFLFQSLLKVSIQENHIYFSKNDYFQLFVSSAYLLNDNFFSSFKNDDIQFSMNDGQMNLFVQNLYEEQKKKINSSFLSSCLYSYKLPLLYQLLSYLIEDKKELYRNMEIQLNNQAGQNSHTSSFQETIHNIPSMENSILNFYQALSLKDRKSVKSYCHKIIEQLLIKYYDKVYKTSLIPLRKSEHQVLLDLHMKPIQERYHRFIQLFEKIDLYLEFEKSLDKSIGHSQQKI